VSIRPEQPEPFLRGCVFPAVIDAPYPRADPAGHEYLPADVWDAAQLPVGVRLELVGNARTIRVWYETTRASLGYRGESAGCNFVAYRAGQKVAMVEAVMGEGMAELTMTGRPDAPVTVYLPEGMGPLVTGVAGVDETMSPAPLQPRWLAYGDAVTQGWLASAPAMAWPAVAGRKLGLDVCNLGYAGTARGETTSAVMLAETPAEVVSVAFGLNNWSRVPHTTGLMAEEVRCFLSVIRNGHPEVPIVVVSPTARPDAEDTPNRVGATLAELRRAMEETVRHQMVGDEKLFLVEGLHVVDPEDLEDGMYPGDEGHRRLAAAVAKVIVPLLADLQAAAEKRWAAEGTPPTPVAASASAPPPVPSAMDAPRDPTAVATGPLNLDVGDFDALDRASLHGALDALSPAKVTGPDGDVFGEGRFDGASVEAPPPPPTAHDTVDSGETDATGFGAGHVATQHPEMVLDGDSSEASVSQGAPLGEAAPVDDAADEPIPLVVAGRTDSEGSVADAASAHDDAEATEPKTPARRDMTPVDIEIADMVVAALTLATNGADDVIFGHDDVPEAEFQWVDSLASTPGEELQWADPSATDELQWTEPVGADELQWTDPLSSEELQWADPSVTDELQWTEPVGADELPWSHVPASDELQWTGADEAAPADELQWSTAEPGQF
jgi:lysophospholipase L1-like esterase